MKAETVLTALTIGLLSCYSKMRYGPVGPTWAPPDKLFGDDTGLNCTQSMANHQIVGYQIVWPFRQ